MRMLHALAILLAVLCAAVGAGADEGDAFVNVSRVRRTPSPLPHHPHRMLMDEELDSTAMWKRMHWREMQTIIRTEGSKGSVECCPSVHEMIAPKGGRTPSGLYVELFEDGKNKQQLYDLSCAPDVVDKPCRFVDARLYNQSRCVQKYSYSYALVRNPAATEMPHRHRREGQFNVPGSLEWSMDYVRVRAGCECEIIPPKRKVAHRKRFERHRQRKRNRRIEEDDET